MCPVVFEASTFHLPAMSLCAGMQLDATGLSLL